MTDNWENQPNDQSQGTSALKLANQSGLFYGNRPIEPSHLQIVNTYTTVGSLRPITKSGLNIKGMLTLSGSRPIVSSNLKISQEFKIMGNRPVASNHIDDVLLLMGYLD
ncbi:hypothetical protein [Geminocystis sp. NIES-3709]|uniref:hypothetical protein n=1 Tax=Geminocystis sp. NIES-3709 TaxID=1617448 RepID=UPI0005FC6C37|nr:hypothetical protein [Geminocystis sp. NIES-3709]BAQ63389.1 hypothetical protein GM3709_154 [Geminocystis sp. NIES-3709]